MRILALAVLALFVWMASGVTSAKACPVGLNEYAGPAASAICATAPPIVKSLTRAASTSATITSYTFELPSDEFEATCRKTPNDPIHKGNNCASDFFWAHGTVGPRAVRIPIRRAEN